MGEENASGTLSRAHSQPASLAVPKPRHEARNSLISEKHGPASPVSGAAGGRGAGGDVRAEIPDLQGLTKAKQMGVNNTRGKQAGNRG